jgi:hypothetical protein
VPTWTTPRTWVTLETVTAAIMNTHVRDNLDFLYNIDRVSVYKGSNQSVADSTWDVLTFGSERFDTNGLHSTSSNTSRLTAVVDGAYLVIGQVHFASNSTGQRVAQIRKNAAGASGSGTGWASESFRAGNTQITRVNLSAIVTLSAGDYVELFAWHDSGAALNVVGGSVDDSFFQMAMLGA